MMDDDFTKLLRRCFAYPANLLLLATIVQQNLTSIEQITAHAEKYGLPVMPEYGLFNWLENGVLVGDIWHFKPNDKIAEKLAWWAKKNSEALLELSDLYRQQLTREREVVEEKKITEKMIFEESSDG